MSGSPGSGSKSQPEPQGRFIPVFCTANIPAETLNLLLERDGQFVNEDSFRLLIVTDTSDDALQLSNVQRSMPPFQPFATPFLGMKLLPDLNEIFWTRFHHRLGFANSVFFVLDSISARDETLVVVEARDPGGITPEDEGIDNLRTDFWVARQVAMLSDLGVEGLLENRDIDTVYTADMPGGVPLEL